MQPAAQCFVVTAPDTKLSSFLKQELDLSISHLKRCLDRQWIQLNTTRGDTTNRLAPNTLLQPNDILYCTVDSFALARIRYAEPLLSTLYSSASVLVLYKPSGMPSCGRGGATVERALPGVLPLTSKYHRIIDCVCRIAAGPVIVALDEGDSSRQQKQDLSCAYTFQVLVQQQHDTAAEELHQSLQSTSLRGFQSVEILQSIPTTTTMVSLLQVVLHNNAGHGLRGALQRVKCPIVGTTTTTKSATNGTYMACTQLHIADDNNDTAKDPIVIHMKVPDKFTTFIQREERFYRQQQSEHKAAVEQEQEWKAWLCQQHPGLCKKKKKEDWTVALFCGAYFYVTDAVMTPRSGSETLIAAAAPYLQSSSCASNSNNNKTILDLGTGSGCLLIAAMQQAANSNNDITTVRGVGIDISDAALAVAQKNVVIHGLTDRIVLQRRDFGNLSSLQQCFDVVLCNPPYLTEGEQQRDNVPGPRVALVAPSSLSADSTSTRRRGGLACYVSIAANIAHVLKPGGVLILEIGGKRKEKEICELFDSMEHVRSVRCSQGRKRCIVLRRTVECEES